MFSLEELKKTFQAEFLGLNQNLCAKFARFAWASDKTSRSLLYYFCYQHLQF